MLDQSSVIQQLLQLTCLRAEVDDLWFISTLQKNLYFFPMENNSFVLCCSVLLSEMQPVLSWTYLLLPVSLGTLAKLSP